MGLEVDEDVAGSRAEEQLGAEKCSPAVYNASWGVRSGAGDQVAIMECHRGSGQMCGARASATTFLSPGM